MTEKIGMTTDPQNEIFPLVDLDNNVIGIISREEAHKSPDKIHRAIYVLVLRNGDEVLLQKRSETKDTFPGCWDLSVGGHVGHNQTYLEAALRESQEELGIAVTEQELKNKGEILVTLPWEQEFFRVYEYALKPGESISSSKEEISSTTFMKLTDVLDSIKKEQEKWSDKARQILEALY